MTFNSDTLNIFIIVQVIVHMNCIFYWPIVQNVINVVGDDVVLVIFSISSYLEIMKLYLATFKNIYIAFFIRFSSY